ncbi:uncharacterized protein LOC106656794 [Trichogramma pretiosum]|uniref:uncharacterized protein LOC106656794 n=1 Tax=Trichogramma pretiosum TaxID=7493 RepID=UPI0006C9BD70|nr:uncharacterized protein LOC106656794 [Trichogramma pretiosum]
MVCKEKIHTCALLMGRMCDTNAWETQAIMFKPLKKGYRISIFQAVAMVILCTSFGISPIAIPSFLNRVLSGNQTHEINLPLHTEMLLSEDEYFYQIFAAQLTSLFIYGLLISAINALQCLSVAYIIGEIRILEYLLHKMYLEYKFKNLVDEKKRNKCIYEQLKYFVDTHRICIEFFNIVHDISNILIFGILIGATCIVVLTATSMIILMETDLTGSTKMLFAFCVTMCAITFVCFPSQMLKNASDDLMFTCYKMNRQSYPAKIRKMLLFIMVRTVKPFVLTAGPTIELNLETCSTYYRLKFKIAYKETFTPSGPGSLPKNVWGLQEPNNKAPYAKRGFLFY